jgi:hypothetical protein
MELKKQYLKFIKGGVPVHGSGGPDLPPREPQVAEQKKVEPSSTDPTAPVEPPKP